MVKNMTEGNPFKLIIGFALPLLMGNLLQQMYNIIDAAIVGRYLGTKALAGVGASTSVQFLIIGFCTGVACGFAIPVAQNFGAKKYELMRRYIVHAGILTVAIAIILTTACVIFCPNILRMLSTPKDIYDFAYSYLVIIFLGIPFTLLYNLLAGILRAVGDSITPFIFLVISAFTNIGLDCLFIMVFDWKCAGAAAATVASQALSGVCCLILIIKKFEILRPKREECRFQLSLALKVLAMGVPMGLQYSITAIGSMVMQSANNGLGSVYVSGFTAATRIKQFAMCPFDAVATGVSNFCSQNLGAGKFDRIKKGLRQGIAIGVAYGIFIGLVVIFGGRLLSQIFVSKEEVQVLDAAAKYLKCLGLFYWSIGILNVCRMTVQGLGYSFRAIFSGAIEMVARIVVSLVFVPIYGFTAICFSDQTAWIGATIYSSIMLIICVRGLEKKYNRSRKDELFKEA